MRCAAIAILDGRLASCDWDTAPAKLPAHQKMLVLRINLGPRYVSTSRTITLREPRPPLLHQYAIPASRPGDVRRGTPVTNHTSTDARLGCLNLSWLARKGAPFPFQGAPPGQLYLSRLAIGHEWRPNPCSCQSAHCRTRLIARHGVDPPRVSWLFIAWSRTGGPFQFGGAVIIYCGYGSGCQQSRAAGRDWWAHGILSRTRPYNRKGNLHEMEDDPPLHERLWWYKRPVHFESICNKRAPQPSHNHPPLSP